MGGDLKNHGHQIKMSLGKKRPIGNKEAEGKRKKQRDIPMFPTVVAPTVEAEEIFPRCRTKTSDSQTLDNSVQQLNESNTNRVKSHLTSSDVSVGCVFTGVIAEYITEDQMFTIHLPSYLTGYVPLSHMTEENLPHPSASLNALLSYYTIGTRVICVVVSCEHSKIFLSLRPSLINAGFSLSSIMRGMWLPVTIKSVEEFGFTASLGVQEPISVYIKHSDTIDTLKESVEYETHCFSFAKIGFVAYVGVYEVNMSSSSIFSSFSPLFHVLDRHAALDQSFVRAGFIVDAQISEIFYLKESQNKQFIGFRFSFCGIFTGVMSALHLQKTASFFLTKEFLLNQKQGKFFKIRLIAVSFLKKKIIGSLLNELVEWKKVTSTLPPLPIGKVIQSLQVIAVESNVGVRFNFKVGSRNVLADVINRHCYDSGNVKHETKSHKKHGLYLNQQIQTARIISVNQFEQSFMVVTAPSLLEQRLLLPQDVVPGQILQGTVQHISKTCVFVKLSQHLTGFLPKDHITDIPVENLPKCIELKKSIQVQVTSIQNQTIWLTMKRGLLLSPNNILGKSFECDFHENQVVLGVVGSVDTPADTVTIHFYNNIKGYLNKSDFQTFEKQHRFQKGCLIQCRVSYVNYFHHTLHLSLNLDTQPSIANSKPSLMSYCHDILKILSKLSSENNNGVTFSNLIGTLKETLVCLPCPHVSSESSHPLRYRFSSYKDFQDHVSAGKIYNHILCVLGFVDHHVIVLFSYEQEKLFWYLQNLTNSSSETSTCLENMDLLRPLEIGLGLIPYGHLSDQIDQTKSYMNDELKKTVQQDILESIKQIVVLDVKARLFTEQVPQEHAGLQMSCKSQKISGILLSTKNSIISVAKESKFVKNPGCMVDYSMQWVPGYVVKIFNNNLYISIGHPRIVGLADIPNNLKIADFSVSQTVWVFIKNRMKTSSKKLFHCSIRLWSIEKPTNLGVSSSNFKVNDVYDATVIRTSEKNVWVKLEGINEVARIPLCELPESPLDPKFCACLYPPKRCLSNVRIIHTKNTLVASCKPMSISFPFKVNDEVLGKVTKKLYNGLVLNIRSVDDPQSTLFKNVFCHVNNIEFSATENVDRLSHRKKWRSILRKYQIGFGVKGKIKNIIKTNSKSPTIEITLLNHKK